MKLSLSPKTFDMLKWIALVLLPATSTLYLALSKVWPLPFPNEIAGTIAAVDVFLGVLLGLSSNLGHGLRAVVATTSSVGLYSAWILSDATYKALLWVAQIALPALATLYFTLAGLWNLPYADRVVATIMALDTFLGMLLQFSMAQFNKIATFHSNK